MNPLVSICTLTYNHKDYVAQCLEGMLSQHCDFEYEILIHDDASTDGTDKIIAEYAKKYPEIIKPVFEEENQFSKSEIKNISGIYNFPRVTGKYIAMCEGDDYWNDDDKLKLQVEYMEAHPDCSLCIHSAYQESTGVAVSKKLMRPYDGDCDISAKDIVNKRVAYPTASLLMRADAFRKLPEYYMKAPIGDIPMQLICASYGYAHYIDKPMATYRYMAPGSWTADMRGADYIAKQKKYAREMAQMYERFDAETDGRFTEEVIDANMRLQYLTRVNVRDWKTIFAGENKKYLAELGVFEMFMLNFEMNFPKAYKLLQKTLIKSGGDR